jgi:hypothetical protein
MAKLLSRRGRAIALLLSLFFGLLALFLTEPTPGQDGPSPSFHDWTTHFVVYPHSGTLRALNEAERDPRARFLWREFERQQDLQRWQAFTRPRQPPKIRRSSLGRDWSINLGTTGTAPAMYPAKYTFDTTAAPSCANDFVVFPVSALGSNTQPNIVAFNNLYSGTTGGNGICNRTASGSDNGTAATVLWSYNVHAISAGAAVPNSPVLSLDGKKVAFVESAAGNAAHFHVLAWNSGDGQDATNLQNVLKPKAITTFSATAPAAGAATDLTFGATTDTLSSPFVDYGRDLAYIGNDAGVVFRIKNVFCFLTSCANAAPSLDPSWGTNGALTIGGTCTGALTAPTLDFVTLNVFVGCADGRLYSISQTGVVKSLAVGDGVASKTYGGIVDPPLVDGVNGLLYVVSGSANSGANSVMVQAKTDLSSSAAANVGVGNQCNMHAPTPNNAYFTSITSAGALIYVGGLSTTGTVNQPCTGGSGGTADVVLYASSFGAGGTMNAGAPADSLNLGPGLGYEWAPMTEFFNATTAIDWLFIAALQSGQTNVAEANITGGFPGGFGSFTLATEGVGTSGMIVDNNSASAQASSIYFNALQENAACNNNTNGGGTDGCAVKLTQSGLN